MDKCTIQRKVCRIIADFLLGVNVPKLKKALIEEGFKQRDRYYYCDSFSILFNSEGKFIEVLPRGFYNSNEQLVSIISLKTFNEDVKRIMNVLRRLEDVEKVG